HPRRAVDQPGVLAEVEEPPASARLFDADPGVSGEMVLGDLAAPQGAVDEDRERTEALVSRRALVPVSRKTEPLEPARDDPHVALDGGHEVDQALLAHPVGERVVLAAFA